MLMLITASPAAAEALQRREGWESPASGGLPTQSPPCLQGTQGRSFSTTTCTPHTLPLLPESLSSSSHGIWCLFLPVFSSVAISQYKESPSTTVVHVNDRAHSTLGSPGMQLRGKGSDLEIENISANESD